MFCGVKTVTYYSRSRTYTLNTFVDKCSIAFTNCSAPTCVACSSLFFIVCFWSHTQMFILSVITRLLFGISTLYLQSSSIRGLATLWIIILFLHCLLFSTHLSKLSPVSPVHFVMLSCQRVLGLPLLLWPEVLALFLSPSSFLLSVAHDHNKKALFSWLTVAITVLFQLPFFGMSRM